MQALGDSAAASPPEDIPEGPCRLLDLPLELLTHVLRELPAWALARTMCTCRTLHNLVAGEDHLWRQHLDGVVPRWQPLAQKSPVADRRERQVAFGSSPAIDEDNEHPPHAPFGSYREMYAAHAPYWFLPQQRLWFADRLTGHQELIGQLAVARYEDRLGALEMVRLQANLTSQQILMQWSFDPRVILYSFDPTVTLQCDDTILRLEPGQYGPGPRLRREIDLPAMSERYRRGMRCRLMLTRAIPPAARVPPAGLWPPSRMPHEHQVRCQSPSQFTDPSHRPSTHTQVCETAFRTRMWAHFHGMNGAFGIRIGEEVATWSSLPKYAYTPTCLKPWQGIWVGDYATHGPEFVLVTQQTPAEAVAAAHVPILSMTDDVRKQIGLPRVDERLLGPLGAGGTAQQAQVPMQQQQEAGDGAPTPALLAPDGDGLRNPSGRLEAIKLTGDPNVPRGEYTFVAEDVGPRGLFRIATEAPFAGARIVRSWGHVAARGFTVDGWIPGQLILLNRNRIAQYWIETGHVVWYRRVDWEGLLRGDAAPDGLVLDDEGELE